VGTSPVNGPKAITTTETRSTRRITREVNKCRCSGPMSPSRKEASPLPESKSPGPDRGRHQGPVRAIGRWSPSSSVVARGDEHQDEAANAIALGKRGRVLLSAWSNGVSLAPQ
jgi:hypothetical protein